jgi:hypothetical protein
MVACKERLSAIGFQRRSAISDQRSAIGKITCPQAFLPKADRRQPIAESLVGIGSRVRSRGLS